MITGGSAIILGSVNKLANVGYRGIPRLPSGAGTRLRHPIGEIRHTAELPLYQARSVMSTVRPWYDCRARLGSTYTRMVKAVSVRSTGR